MTEPPHEACVHIARPTEIVTSPASDLARAPSGTWATVPARTNDEAGELANTFNQMTGQPEEARRLERRLAEATRGIATLYDVGRTATSTLPESSARVLAGPDVLCLPLVFKDEYLGLVLASLDCAAAAAPGSGGGRITSSVG